MKKTMTVKKRFLVGAVLCILLPVFFGCNNSGAFINPFIGIWNDGGEYWEFRTDGTGGWASTQDGPFGNDFSFFVYAGQDIQTTPSEGSLLIFEDSVGVVDVPRYVFTITGNQAVLTQIPTPQKGVTIITLERVKGRPQALNLDNILIGEWVATWDSVNGMDWSLKYRKDGTLKVFHHQMEHQFENGYALRGNILVIFGDMRFGGFSGMPVIANILPHADDDHLKVVEEGGYPVWNYTRVVNAPWLPETTE
jgi:hypothetical protein